MSDTLDITPLRSFVTIAATGGFGKAATALHLTQAAVSQHVRKLEQATGRRLVTKSGRLTRFTGDGERLLADARRILAAHDETLRGFAATTPGRPLNIHLTEHAAEKMLPEISLALHEVLGDRQVRFRLDRTATVMRSLTEGDADLAITVAAEPAPETERSRLRLAWYAAAGFTMPDLGAGETLPVIAFDELCMLRRPMERALSEAGIGYQLVAEVSDFSSGCAAARAGLGVFLLPTIGPGPEALVEVDRVPVFGPIRMRVDSAPDVPARTTRAVAGAVRRAMRG